MARKYEVQHTFLTTKEAARMLRLSWRTLEGMRLSENGPPFLRLGHDKNSRVVYRLSDIESWLEGKLRLSTKGEWPTIVGAAGLAVQDAGKAANTGVAKQHFVGGEGLAAPCASQPLPYVTLCQSGGFPE